MGISAPNYLEHSAGARFLIQSPTNAALKQMSKVLRDSHLMRRDFKCNHFLPKHYL
jgi:hypothetical protein